MTGTTEAVRVERLKVVRGPRVVFDGLDLSIAPGRVTGLLGPSGSGKSTLIRAIVGVQIVAGGSVTVLGEPAGSRGLRHRVSYLTQAPSIYDDLSVRDNVRFFASLLGRSRADADQAVARVRLDDHAKALGRNLSGGQLTRLSLACSLVSGAELLVLDEPTVGLDPVLRRDLWQLFHELAEQGSTLVVSSHVMDEAARCDDLVLLRHGRLIANCTMPELLSQTGTADAESAFLALIDARENR